MAASAAGAALASGCGACCALAVRRSLVSPRGLAARRALRPAGAAGCPAAAAGATPAAPQLLAARSFRRYGEASGRSRWHATSAGRVRVSAVAAGGPGTPTELPKNFDASESEGRLYSWWDKQGYFQPTEQSTTGRSFTVPMPPPNVTGALHMGHAMFVTLEDIMVRYHRMLGDSALWLPGTDHAGIATQLVVERMLKAEGLSRLELGREEFEKRVWQWKRQYGGRIVEQLRRLGASCDWSRERFTLDEGLSRAVAEAFVRLHDKGLVYKGSYMVNWSPNLQTAVSDLEVEYTEEQGSMYFFKYMLAGSDGEYLPVATTRPETVLGDTAVAVHPEDDRYKQFVGKKVVVPFSGREIPVIADEYVERELGTGALKITPGHDPNDYEIGKRRGLPIVNIMNKDGTLNEVGGPYAGMDRADVRKKLWADMEAAGMTIQLQPHTLRVPRSQRGGEVVEPLVSEQWFVKMEPLATPALEAVHNGSLRVVPDRFEKVYKYWLENIKDWCVSRQLWWGHRIPAWYASGDNVPAGAYIVARNEEEAQSKARDMYGEGVVLRQEDDVLDTWFSSGLWPFSTLGWPDRTADFSKFYPTSVLETGHDILFFWVARMIMMGLEFTGETPFHTVYLHGLVRDAQGRKMSKSLGNVIDPLDTIDQYGADALRFTLATGTAPGQDVNLAVERIEANRNFTNKIWNAGRFILFNLTDVTEDELKTLSHASFTTDEELQALPLAERWVVSKLHEVATAVTRSLDKYDFNEAGRVIYDFFWSEFADWYIEASKTRLYKNPDPSAAPRTRAVLVYCMVTMLKLLHPFMPFVTEELWQALPHTGQALIIAQWPAANLPQDTPAVERFTTLQDLVRSLRNLRAEYGVEPVKKVPATLVVSSSDLMQDLQAEAAVIATLAKLDSDRFMISSSASGVDTENSVQLVVREGLEAWIPLAGLLDIAKELQRLTKQATKLEADVGQIQQRLSSPKFVEKAPAAVVQGAREQAAEAQERLDIIRRRIEQLRQMEASSSAESAEPALR
eukprot:jgi/Chlat1/5434/Chrsp36S05441